MSALQPGFDAWQDAVTALREGALLAYPTETVWGLGADASSETAVARLRAWKDTAQPTALLVEDAAALARMGCELNEIGRRLIRQFWPGPLTLVCRCRQRFAAGIARADGAVGVRCSSHPLAAGLAERLAREGIGPVTATSFNRHGGSPVRSRDEAKAQAQASGGSLRLLGGAGPDAGGFAASSVVDLTGAAARVIRYGALPAEQLDAWLESEGRS